MRKLLVALILLVILPLGAARQFDGSDDVLIVETAAVTNEPFTLACWFNMPNITTDSALITINDVSSGTLGWGLEARGATGGDPLRARKGNTVAAVTSTGFSADTWHHGVAIFASDTSRDVFIDGGSKGSDATSVGDLTADRTAVGAWEDATPSNFTDGKVAEVGIWNVALTDAEVAILAKGFSPLFVRPQNLVFYAPLIGRTSPEIELIQGNNMTVTGAVVADHSPIIYHTQPISGFAVAAVPPAVTRRPIIIVDMMKYAPVPILAGGLGLAWVINRRNKLIRDGRRN